MNLDDFTIDQLKVFVYDQSKALAICQQNINIAEQLIMKKMQEPVEEVNIDEKKQI